MFFDFGIRKNILYGEEFGKKIYFNKKKDGEMLVLKEKSCV